MKEWYHQTQEELCKELETCSEGLSSETAAKHLEKYGKNAIAEARKKPVWLIFLEQFRDLLVIILIIAALISAFTGDPESFIVIIAVITMNAILGTVQTVKAERSLSDLKKLSSPTAKVLRDGKTTVLASEDITVGDVVLLEAGDRIPADGRLIECASLRTNESALTGESTDVEKSIDPIDGDVPLAERKNMVYSGGFVSYGRGAYIVTDVGMQTEVGKIASLIHNAEARKTPLQITLDQFGKRLSIAILFVSVLVFVLSMLRVEIISVDTVMDSLMFAIALAVAAIPEALSSIVTIVLSFGTQRMSQEHAIMRKLQAVEGLGSVSVICSDKTGTLTQNKMTVRKISVREQIIDADSVSTEDPKVRELITASVLCSDASCQDGTEIGDPTETALVRFAQDCGLSDKKMRTDHQRVGEIPFDSERKLMSTLNRCGDMRKMYTKGATDVLLGRMLISDEEKKAIRKRSEELSEQGLRVLCFAEKTFCGEALDVTDENDLTYLGLIAEMDPPRKESGQAVAECKAAGIKPIMITGDHIVTASAIAKEIGILERREEAVEGAVLDAYTDDQLVDLVKDKSVYARVTPEHKIRIVRAWQKRGNIVAMTGDGVNDAPALKQADVGVAMGITGTEVAKDAADMVLTDDNFATIVKAVNNGRNIYENIKKAILFLLSGNLAGIIAVLFCSLAGLPVPFAPIHLLFINLLTDSLPAIALGLEPYSDDVMKKSPRPSNESILTKAFLAKVGYSGIIISIATISAFLLGYFYQGAYNAGAAMTMAFATLCMSRLFHGFSCKSEKPVLFTKRMWDNKYAVMAFLAGMVLINAVLWIPGLHELFRIENGMSGVLIGAVYGLSFGSMVLIQIVKAVVSSVKKTK